MCNSCYNRSTGKIRKAPASRRQASRCAYKQTTSQTLQLINELISYLAWYDAEFCWMTKRDLFFNRAKIRCKDKKCYSDVQR